MPGTSAFQRHEAIPLRTAGIPFRWRVLPPITLFGLIAATLFATGCSRIAVRTMVDSDASFSAYSTFAFAPDAGRPPLDAPPPRRLAIVKDPRFHADLQEAIGSTLVAKGFRPVRAGARPDLLIAYHTVVSDQAHVVPPIYGAGWRGHVQVAHPGYVRWYKEGTLVLDIIDPSDDRLIWRGVGVGAMRDLLPGEPLTDAVRKILEKFPPT